MASPKITNLLVTVGNRDIIINHANFLSLSIKRRAKDVCNSFTLEVLDTSANELEAVLLSGNNAISITYLDDNMNVVEGREFTGYIYKMTNAFKDNRVLLTIEGFVGISINDKYDRYSLSWNVIPRFNMTELFGSAAEFTTWDENRDVKSGFDNLVSDLEDAYHFYKYGVEKIYKEHGILGLTLPGLLYHWIAGDTSNTMLWPEWMSFLFTNDLFFTNKNGEFYTIKYDDLKDDSLEKIDPVSEEDNTLKVAFLKRIVKAEGNYVIPIRPHKLLKLILEGGAFTDLLEENYTDYIGTSFYQSSGFTNADWLFIQLWFKKMGKFQGLGYTNFKCDYNLDLAGDEFIQTKESFTEFIFNKILPKCVETINGNTYANFFISFDSDKTATVRRLDASIVPENIPEYTYYGVPKGGILKGSVYYDYKDDKLLSRQSVTDIYKQHKGSSGFYHSGSGRHG